MNLLWETVMGERKPTKDGTFRSAGSAPVGFNSEMQKRIKNTTYLYECSFELERNEDTGSVYVCSSFSDVRAPPSPYPPVRRAPSPRPCCPALSARQSRSWKFYPPSVHRDAFRHKPHPGNIPAETRCTVHKIRNIYSHFYNIKASALCFHL